MAMQALRMSFALLQAASAMEAVRAPVQEPLWPVWGEAAAAAGAPAAGDLSLPSPLPAVQWKAGAAYGSPSVQPLTVHFQAPAARALGLRLGEWTLRAGDFSSAMGDMSPEGMGAGAARLMEEAPREEPGSAAEAIAELGELAAHDTGRALRMIKGILLGRADPRPEVRRAAAGTLARLCHPDVVTAAQEVLLLFDEESAGKARKARGMSQEELASFLAADQDAPFRRLAAQILLERSDTGEVSGDRAAIVKLLKKRFNEDPNPSVRAVIRLALRRYGEDPGESEFDLHLARMADGSEPLSKGWLGGLKRFVSNW